jgi:RNA polymerase sigma-70 factor (ECF subfamily)
MSLLELVGRRSTLARGFQERRRRLHRVAYTWCQDRSLADDLVQETLVKALKSLDSLRELNALDGWLFQILANCWRDHIRRRRGNEDIENLADDIALATDGDYHRSEIVAKVRRAVAHLPVGQREVLALVDLEGFSYAEVANMLDIPQGTVTSRISRAREALRVALADLCTEGSARPVYLRRVK